MSNLPQMSAAEISALRQNLNKTQAEMAALFGVDLRTFRRWENDERSMPGPAVILARYIMRDHESVKK
jgi:DNA-binding transcriptional regulator YiaG